MKYVELGKLCNIKTGKLNANKSDENGIYPFFTCNEKPLKINEYAFDTSAILISGNGSKVGHINHYEGKFNAYQRTYVLDNFKDIEKKYLYYILKNDLKKYIKKNSKKAPIPYITLPMLQKFKIPLIPLDKQQKIIAILDKYTKKTDKLIENLNIEYILRHKQYEYYKNLLLTFGDDVKKYKIKDICIRQKGINITALKMKEIEDKKGDIKIFAAGNTVVNTFYSNLKNEKIIEKPSVIVKSRGNIDFEFYNKKFVHKNEMWSYTNKDDKAIIKYVYYYLKIKKYYFIKQAVNGKLPQISTVVTDDYEIPLPSSVKQQEIVSILDKYTNLYNNIRKQILTEIELIKKQYKHYRNLILNL